MRIKWQKIGRHPLRDKINSGSWRLSPLDQRSVIDRASWPVRSDGPLPQYCARQRNDWRHSNRSNVRLCGWANECTRRDSKTTMRTIVPRLQIKAATRKSLICQVQLEEFWLTGNRAALYARLTYAVSITICRTWASAVWWHLCPCLYAHRTCAQCTIVVT